MVKRIKKPPVKPEQRYDWLKRYESGVSPPKIAEADSFDVRTVRRQIEKAKEEMEVKEARTTVLRSALERHYTDLCEFAEKVDSVIAGEGAISPELKYDRMGAALRQHVPRYPLWNYLVTWDNIQQELTVSKGDVKKRLEKELGSDARLNQMPNTDRSAVVNGCTAALTFQIEQWSRGGPGINIIDNFRVKPAKEKGVSNIEYGSFHMDNVHDNCIQTVKDVLADWESMVRDWEEYTAMEKLSTKLFRTKSKLLDELAVIILRRIVPGRCKYCPL